MEPTVMVAVVSALGSVLTALFGWLTRKGVNYVDLKTKALGEGLELQRREAVKERVVDAVTLAARATTQTYVDELKSSRADGRLTKEEAAEAFRRTMDRSGDLLKREGIEMGKDVLGVVVEAVVGKLKGERGAVPRDPSLN